MEARFIVDNNVGKLARWLRLMGYDTVLFSGEDDGEMVRIALFEGRILLTRDTRVMKRRLITRGRIRAVLVEHENVERQMQQVASELSLNPYFMPFSRCLECNTLLVPRERGELEGLVPPYVFRTQTRYVGCPNCGRIYWRGTHWQAMQRRLEKVADNSYNRDCEAETTS